MSRSGLLAAASLLALAVPARAQELALNDINQMSIQQPSKVEITSVSKAAEPLSDAPVYVISHDDAIRSGATSLPDLLRLAPNLEAMQTSSSNYVALSVRDTGVGISEEARKRALDPFFITKPLGKGTGLGLSMTFGYVRQSSGYLRIESRPGKGATVTILMPCIEEIA